MHGGGGGRALSAQLGVEVVSSPCHAELVSASDQCCELPVSPDRFRNKFGMTPTESRAIIGLRAHGRRIAFTMAEILLSLTIIGVVAAITLPSLTGNINERTWNTQRKALYARFSQAIALMPALNGYGTVTEGGSSTSAVDTAAETFVTAGLSKVLKINNVCDSDHLPDCGISSKINTLAGGVISSFPLTMEALNPEMVSMSYSDSYNTFNYDQLNTKAAAFETANGESIVVYYNPFCRPDLQSTAYGDVVQPKVCANFVYDLNGTKGPNTVGKDVGFITVFYPTDSAIAAPIPHLNTGENGLSVAEGSQYCSNLDSEYRLPNKDEAAAMFVNKKLIGNLEDSSTTWFLTSSRGVNSSGTLSIWTQSLITGNRLLTPGLATTGVSFARARCVKRN